MAETQLETRLEEILQLKTDSLALSERILGGTDTTGTNIDIDLENGNVTVEGTTLVFESAPDLTYTELEYIQSTGTQYIDMQTENMLVDGCKVFTTVSVNNPTSNTQTLFGAEEDNPYKRNYLMKKTNNWELGCYGYSNFNYTFSADTIYEIECSTLKNNGYVKINNQIIGTYNDNDDRTINSLYLLAFNQNSTAVLFGAYKLYSFKLYNADNTLIRDFIPVENIYNNEVCLYDKVAKQFFINQGTGSFIAGPEKNSATGTGGEVE